MMVTVLDFESQVRKSYSYFTSGIYRGNKLVHQVIGWKMVHA
jgi:hypothetical protein